MDNHPIKILIIDDDQVDRLRLARILKECRNVKVECIDEAVDKATGHAALAAKPYDLVLLDFHLPDGTGLSFLEEVKEQEESMPPFIMQTVLDDDDTGVMAIDRGAQDYLVKGRFDSKALARSILYARERHKLMRKNTALVRELERLTTLDPLTGAYNRRYLDSYLELKAEEAKRYGRRFSLVLFDIDAFKTINDTHGHHEGDRVLQEVVRLARQRLRVTDMLVRYGGDEFVIILPEAETKQARVVLEAIRRMVEKLQIESNAGEMIGVTISIGLAQFPEDGDDQEKIMAAADRRLYLAKKAGKNSISSSEELDEPCDMKNWGDKNWGDKNWGQTTIF